ERRVSVSGRAGGGAGEAAALVVARIRVHPVRFTRLPNYGASREVATRLIRLSSRSGISRSEKPAKKHHTKILPQSLSRMLTSTSDDMSLLVSVGNNDPWMNPPTNNASSNRPETAPNDIRMKISRSPTRWPRTLEVSAASSLL